ncbi:MAG: methanogenesis marker 3 protein [Thermoplasmatales archaeon]|nr:methanogenesis marker 3 protein [Thermoplasmatales archaeon]
MIVTVNGKEKKLKAGARLKDALAGEGYVPGTLVSVHLSTERLTEESNEFEIRTNSGRSIFIKLDDSPEAAVWRASIDKIVGISARWVTRKVAALGSFPTDIKGSRETRMYRKYDCFFSLGGFDNRTTYFMIARDDHRASYGAGAGRIGRVTKGRHLVDGMYEGDTILSITPSVSETSRENIEVTSDLNYALTDGCSVRSKVVVDLNADSPVSAEHLLVLSGKGYLEVTDETGSFAGCSEDMDVDIPVEGRKVREAGSVTVRNSGVGRGRIHIYRERRQVTDGHNDAGRVSAGMAIVAAAKDGERFAIETNPPRILAVGRTQADASALLSAAGIKQVRTGDRSDGAIVVDQTPERTLTAVAAGSVETFGVDPARVFTVAIDDRKADSARFFRKVTGLSHKPVGEMKVHFTYPGMSMITFEGDPERGKSLYPHEPFKRCRRGDIGITNQSRPHAGLMGIRLDDSKEYGPTGEEPPGTNIVGRFTGDLALLLDGLDDGHSVYIREEKP